MQGAERLYRIRVGDYRIVYELDPAALQITIHYVRHRREVYRRLDNPGRNALRPDMSVSAYTGVAGVGDLPPATVPGKSCPPQTECQL